MNEYKFIGMRNSGDDLISTTDYVYAENEKEAVTKYLNKFHPIPFEWEFCGRA